MRGRIVYSYPDEDGNVLTWFGRDPEFEEKHRCREATDRSERDPEKFRFVKGFHRGLELYGQYGRQLQLEKQRTKLEKERAALDRWMSRLKRAFRAIEKQQARIARLERQISKTGQLA